MEKGRKEQRRVDSGGGTCSLLCAPVILVMKAWRSVCSDGGKMSFGFRCCSLTISCVHCVTWDSSSAISRSSRTFSCFLFSTSGSGGCRFSTAILPAASSGLSSMCCVDDAPWTGGAFGRSGDCFTGSFMRGGRLLGEENNTPRRGTSCSSPCCDGVVGSSGPTSSTAPTVIAALLPATLFVRGIVFCASR